MLYIKMTAYWQLCEKIMFSPDLLLSPFLPGVGIFKFICCSSLYPFIFCCQSGLLGPSVFRQSGCCFCYCHLCFYKQSKARGLTDWVLPSSSTVSPRFPPAETMPSPCQQWSQTATPAGKMSGGICSRSYPGRYPQITRNGQSSLFFLLWSLSGHSCHCVWWWMIGM